MGAIAPQKLTSPAQKTAISGRTTPTACEIATGGYNKKSLCRGKAFGRYLWVDIVIFHVRMLCPACSATTENATKKRSLFLSDKGAIAWVLVVVERKVNGSFLSVFLRLSNPKIQIDVFY